ncbi:hypothetical protein B0H10DRAFT_2314921 [Mycena sp. CBHHK59/15]|nr:hypothetical protein B0H10DRAFT_2314921 [Mycena sp. CBHHK59/15]
MAPSTSSTSDCFMIELKIAPLDAFAELNDATGARMRYLTRREIAAPTVSSSSIAGRSALPVIPQDPMEVIHIPPMANFIPVHADLGPGPARNIKAYDQFLTTTIPTESLGPYCQVVGTLVFGNPMTPQNGRRCFNVEFDLGKYEPLNHLPRLTGLILVPARIGSNDLWVYGTDCKKHASRPNGWPGSPAMFWFPQSPERNQKASERVYTAKYADGSFAGKFFSGVLEYVPTKRVVISEYELWTDFVYLHPYWGPPPVQEPDKAWLHLTFGVASQVSSSYRRAPTSGILGLGRRRRSFNKFDLSYHITFGRRPNFSNLASDRFGPWYNHLPVLGNEHWVVASTTKKLDGKTYTYNNGTAELDTGCTTKNLGHLTFKHQFYHLIPVEVNATPHVELDIGGHLFTLQHSRLPQATTYDIKGKMYYVGAIQPKALLMANSDGAAFDGPDLIGREKPRNLQLIRGPHPERMDRRLGASQEKICNVEKPPQPKLGREQSWSIGWPTPPILLIIEIGHREDEICVPARECCAPGNPYRTSSTRHT